MSHINLSSNESLLPSAPPVILQTFAEWQFALQWIKHLYIKGSYRDCINHCEALLQAPQLYGPKLVIPTGNRAHTISDFQVRRLHRAFLHFYAGTSHEILAEQGVGRDSQKIENLQAAKRHFGHATAILPEPRKPPNAADTRAVEPGCPPHRATVLKRYESHLHTLSGLLKYHAQWVYERLVEVETAKASVKDDAIELGDLSFEERRIAKLRERISQARARGWSRIRFDATSTQELVRRALDEAQDCN